jgi:4-alpha-glucanotransferase
MMETMTETQIQESSIQSLAQAYDIQLEWRDIWGNVHPVTEEMCRALLSAMEVPAANQAELDRSFEKLQYATVARWLEPVMVVSETEQNIRIPLHLPVSFGDRAFAWQLQAEEGEVREGRFFVHDLHHVEDIELAVHHEKIGRYEFQLEGLPPQGYHRFIVREAEAAGRDKTAQNTTVPAEGSVDMLLVVTPTRCFLPAVLDEGASQFHGDDPEAAARSARVWGPAVQLYAVNSSRNWGVGDYTDLTKIVDWCAEKGAALVGLNPLHALFPHNPAHSSPYSPSSRIFFNVLLLDPEAIEDFSESEEARQLAYSPEFQEAFKSLRAETFIQYAEVGRLKFKVLEVLYQNFCARHLAKNTPRAVAFKKYIQEQGLLLQRFALFHALQERFHKEDSSIWGWPAWPEAYRNPESPAVQEFLETSGERVGYYQYLQWQVDCQLAKADERCLEKNLGIGLYMDMAVGVDRGGADVWANQHLFAQSSAVGAPPDEYNQKGQDWGLPPLIPERMREEQYRSFIEILRQNMKHAGALRIDHVMGLMRLFWIPPNLPPSQGAYIHYPVDELFGILALESQRNGCLVIGEDMGTVPDIVRDRMQRWGVYSYKVFYFEKEGEDRFKPPEQYQDTAAVAVSTHDLPTLTGFWQGQDIAVRTELDLYPNRDLQERQVRDRVLERVSILNLLEQHGLLPPGASTDPMSVPVMTPELTTAIHRLVAQTRSKVFMVQFEDMLQQPDQINLPGTTEPVYPCWRRRLTAPLEDLFTDVRVQDICQALAEERPKRGPFPSSKAGRYRR